MTEKLKIKILGINTATRVMKDKSPYNTGYLVNVALDAAKKFGEKISDKVELETEYFEMATQEKKLRMCLECNRRYEIPDAYQGDQCPKSDCIIKNDMMKDIWEKVSQSQGFIFGSPVFTGSYSTYFRMLFDRLQAANWINPMTFKVGGCVSTAYMPFGGQEMALEHMMTAMRWIEMVPVNWLNGAPGISGPPYGPTPYDDNGTVRGVEKDKFGLWLSKCVGRRVAEWAVLLNFGKQAVGMDLFKQEFIQRYHPPHGNESWWW